MGLSQLRHHGDHLQFLSKLWMQKEYITSAHLLGLQLWTGGDHNAVLP